MPSAQSDPPPLSHFEVRCWKCYRELRFAIADIAARYGDEITTPEINARLRVRQAQLQDRRGKVRLK